MLSQRAETDPMTELFEAVKSPTTRRKYELRMRQFLAWVFGDKGLGTPNRQGKKLALQEETEKDKLTREYAKKFVARARVEPEWASGAINDFLGEIKVRVESRGKDRIEASTVSIYSKPLKLFCTMNDISVNWAKLSRKLPKGRQAADDRPPTLEEVRKILQYPDRRIKPVVLVMLSSGIRVGSWDHLRWGHIEKVEVGGKLVAAKMKIFNSKSRRWYLGFITPEAYRAVEEYIEYRRGHGEPVTMESPVIRDLLDSDKGGSGWASKPSPLSSRGVKRLIEQAIQSAGVRSALEPGKRRHPFKSTHGFRKYYDTVTERHLKTLHVEQLLDHDTGLKESYNRPTEGDLLNDYLKAIPDLTVLDPAARTEAAPDLVRKVEELSAEIAEVRKQMQVVNAAYQSLKVLASASSGALGKAREQLGDRKVDEFLLKALQEQGAKSKEWHAPGAPERKKGPDILF